MLSYFADILSKGLDNQNVVIDRSKRKRVKQIPVKEVISILLSRFIRRIEVQPTSRQRNL